MGRVKVTSGMIYHGENKHEPGDVFDAENAENLVRLGVAVFVDEPEKPAMTIEENPEPAPVVETTEQPEKPAMTVEQTPFKKSGKRGRKHRG